MKYFIFIFGAIIFCQSCASIPRETISLSQAIDTDLIQLHEEHQKLAELYFNKLETDIITFIDDVYMPFVIHNVLKKELDNYKANAGGTIYDALNSAGTQDDKQSAELILTEMSDFQTAANLAISNKRTELLSPITAQKNEVLGNINSSFDNIHRASTTITNYLKSIGKLKESQEIALSKLGMKNANQTIRKELLEVSSLVDKALSKGRQIDIKSDEAIHKINAVSDDIKKAYNKIK